MLYKTKITIITNFKPRVTNDNDGGQVFDSIMSREAKGTGKIMCCYADVEKETNPEICKEWHTIKDN